MKSNLITLASLLLVSFAMSCNESGQSKKSEPASTNGPTDPAQLDNEDVLACRDSLVKESPAFAEGKILLGQKSSSTKEAFEAAIAKNGHKAEPMTFAWLITVPKGEEIIWSCRYQHAEVYREIVEYAELNSIVQPSSLTIP